MAKEILLSTGNSRFSPGSGRSSEKMATTRIFLSGKAHGQRSFCDYSPWVTRNWTQLSDYTTTAISIRNFF